MPAWVPYCRASPMCGNIQHFHVASWRPCRHVPFTGGKKIQPYPPIRPNRGWHTPNVGFLGIDMDPVDSARCALTDVPNGAFRNEELVVSVCTVLPSQLGADRCGPELFEAPDCDASFMSSFDASLLLFVCSPPQEYDAEKAKRLQADKCECSV